MKYFSYSLLFVIVYAVVRIVFSYTDYFPAGIKQVSVLRANQKVNVASEDKITFLKMLARSYDVENQHLDSTKIYTFILDLSCDNCSDTIITDGIFFIPVNSNTIYPKPCYKFWFKQDLGKY